MKCVKILLDHGVNINERSNNGKTAVHWATHWGHDTIVHYLLEQGANLTIPDKDGMTVLMTAVLSGKAALVSLLLKSGVPLAITAVNIHNGNALSIAEAKGNQEIIDMLRPYFPAPPQEVSPYWVVVEIFAEQTKQLDNGKMLGKTYEKRRRRRRRRRGKEKEVENRKEEGPAVHFTSS
eukprot:scaffold912_cov187-Ochromonas_danica.AAC.51